MVFAYIRVSTDKQDCDNQKIGIKQLARQRGLKIDNWIEDDSVSGTVDYKKRNLGKLINTLSTGDVVLISEMSRLARNMYMLFEILKYLTENEIQMYSVKDGYSLDGTISSKVLAFGLGLAAEIERDMISKRTTEGLENKKRLGAVLGRPIGSKNRKCKLEPYKDKIAEYLARGVSLWGIAKTLGCEKTTLRYFIRANNLEYKPDERYPVPANVSPYKDICIDKDRLLQRYVQNGYSLKGILGEFGFVSLSTFKQYAIKQGVWSELATLCQQQRTNYDNSGFKRRCRR